MVMGFLLAACMLGILGVIFNLSLWKDMVSNKLFAIANITLNSQYFSFRFAPNIAFVALRVSLVENPFLGT